MSKAVIISVLIAIALFLVLFAAKLQKENRLEMTHAENAQFSFQVSNPLIQQSGNELKVFLNTGSQPITFTRSTISFNPSQLQLQDTVTRSAQFGFEIMKTSTAEANNTGKLTLVYVPCSSTNRACFSQTMPSGYFNVTTFSFKPSSNFKTGSSVISIDANDSQVITTSGISLPITTQPLTLSYAATTVPTLVPTKTPSPTQSALPPQATPSLFPTGAIKAEYFNNKTLTGTPVLTRSESAISNDWKQSSPATGVNRDNFSVRWTSTQSLEQGNYKFIVTADDGIRLFVDGNKIIDQWKDQSATTYSVNLQMSQGSHTIVVEYYEGGWDAVAKVSWSRQTAEDQYYKAEYYTNKTFSGTPIVRQVSNINFDWGTGSPFAGIPNDNFSARFSKSTYFAEGDYQFSMTVDDAGRVYVDKKILIDQWRDQPPTTFSSRIHMSEGLHFIQMDYAEAYVTALAKLSWTKL